MWSVKKILDLMDNNGFLYYIKKFKIEENNWCNGFLMV